jgi:N-acetylmuramoyl-L-alanine amidase
MAKIIKNYSLNFGIPKRLKKEIKFIILHYTGMKKESLAIKKLCDENSKVSSHYFIKKNGELLILVPDLYEAWHAGKSSWKKIKSLNKYSIGIEIQNQGHDYKYEKFSSKQINTLKKLLQILIKKYQISADNILGHYDIAPERKKDPGEKFPWKKLAKANLAKWHKLNEKKIKSFRSKKLNMIEEISLIKNIYSLGYNKIRNFDHKLNKKFLLTAFQRRFRQGLINGKSDLECLIISKNLIKY